MKGSNKAVLVSSATVAVVFIIVSHYCGSTLAIWPAPQTVNYNGQHSINVNRMRFTISATGIKTVDDASQRYAALFFPFGFGSNSQNQVTVKFVLDSSSENLQLFTPEDYNITISAPNGNNYQITIGASGVFGALHGLETLSQLIEVNDTTETYTIYNTPLFIKDFPRFPWRGLLIDSSRHFLPVSAIKKVIDALSYNKFNTLHWHIIDAQSFPIQSVVYPQLTKGAYSPHAIYSTADVKSVISYAHARGVRVVPEFDIPGHGAGWHAGFPEIVTQCPANLEKNINNIPLNPSIPQTFTVLRNFLSEMSALFSDDVLHVGGDETVASCWTQNAEVQRWMSQNGIRNGLGVQQYFEDRILNDIFPALQNNRTPMVWEDLFDAGVQFRSKEVIQEVWSHEGQLQKIVQAGYRAVLAAGYYLDKQIPNTQQTWYEWVDTWKNFYQNDPMTKAFKLLTKDEAGRVLGGEAAMWGEQVDGTNIESRVFPRACAVAEKLWSSSSDTTSVTEALPRLVSFRCSSLARRGIGAGPVAPDWCYIGNN